ncbi:MAG TPA: peptidylprolyl isomerase [Gemmataceae bacterium]|nr:peptidylprolyl isomerase [Gemmataceae bacterium]
MRVRISRNRLLLMVGFVGLAAMSVFWGRIGSLSRATANPPVAGQAGPQQDPTNVAAVAPISSDYSHRVVAYIYDTIPITREDLGEYLIARMGKERLGQLVNRRIIEHVCQQKGIEVTPAEVEADLAETLKGLAVNRNDFVSKVLKPYNKTLYEWKEDVIKPRLMLTKLCRDRVHVTEEDLQKAFEAYHGEKLKCRIILWPSPEKGHVFEIYPKIRDSEEEFDRVSKQQADPKLAAAAGQIEPFGRHTTGNEEMETAAFRLKPGEISQVIETPQGLVVIKCLEHLPPDGHKLDEFRAELTKDIINRKISQVEIPKLFNELRAQAHPTLFLKEGETEEELLREAQRELQDTAQKTSAPPGN